MTIRQS